MGALLDAARARARSARACGALQPIEGEYDEIVEAGVRFAVRVLPLLGKPRPASQPLGERGRDPFDPPEPALTVDEVSPGYVCVLNKFPVLEDHLVLATRRFEPQESALDTRDFAALARWLGAEGGLGFYNAGPAAGASQPHKHLQWLPTPLGRGPEGVPIEPLLGPTPPRGRVALVEGVPFLCAQVAVDAGLAAEDLRDHYRALLAAVGLEASAPYNLLVTRERMWLAPRTRDGDRSIPVNALGYAGSLVVPSREALERLRAEGPLALLAAVGEASATPR